MADDSDATGLFDNVYPGQPLVIPAQVWNAMLDAALANRYGDKQKPGELPRGRSPGIIRIRNDSGAAVDRFGVLGLNGPLFTATDNLAEFQRVGAFSGVTPVPGTHEGKFAILQEPLGIGAIGSAMVSGITPVQITVSGALAAFAEIAATSATLANGATGSARVLSDATGSGSPRWAIVRIGEGGTGSGLASPLTTKGDVWGYSTVDARIPHGIDGEVLTADSTRTLGLKWAPVISGGGSVIQSTGMAGSLPAGGGTAASLTLAASGNYVIIANVLVIGMSAVDSCVLRLQKHAGPVVLAAQDATLNPGVSPQTLGLASVSAIGGFNAGDVIDATITPNGGSSVGTLTGNLSAILIP